MIDYSKKNLKEIVHDIERKMGRDIIYITDYNVFNFYSEDLSGRKTIVFNPGEDNKTLETVNYIYNKLLEFEVNKNTVLVGVGGGIVTDVVGYVASTFMRGLKFGFVSTTLLGMIDASIGGKNGVNFNNYKNLIGNINEPLFIYISTEFLKTLPEREIHAAFGEILKYAIGFDKELFEYLEYSNDIDYDKIINNCSNVKVKVVESDLYEKGFIRKKLNLGHTIGHAIEKYTHNYEHGEAVWIGLYIMNYLSFLDENITKDEFKRIYNLLKKYDYLSLTKEDYINLLTNSIENIKFDKKGISNKSFDAIYITGIGECKLFSTQYNVFKENINKVISLIEKE